MVAEADIPTVFKENTADKGDMIFPCFCCGVCCNDYQPRLDITESRNIAGHLGVSLQKFIDNCTDHRWPGTDTHLLLQKEGRCLFLEQKAAKWLCKIHAFKPDACRQWTAGPEKKECRQGLRCYWGLSVDNSGKMTGSLEDLKTFQTFLKTLN